MVLIMFKYIVKLFFYNKILNNYIEWKILNRLI